jgi:hypothetical protein
MAKKDHSILLTNYILLRCAGGVVGLLIGSRSEGSIVLVWIAESEFVLKEKMFLIFKF